MSKISPRLISQFIEDVPKANAILREKRKAQRASKIASNAYELNFRHSDLSKFKTTKSAIRYIKTTHSVVTGKYFVTQIRNYRQNLLQSFLKNMAGIEPSEKVSVKNLEYYSKYLSQDEADMFNYIFGTERNKIEELAKKDKENLVRYMYEPEQYAQEHMERLKELFNTPKSQGGVAEYAGEYDDYLKYRRSRGL